MDGRLVVDLTSPPSNASRKVICIESDEDASVSKELPARDQFRDVDSSEEEPQVRSLFKKKREDSVRGTDQEGSFRSLEDIETYLAERRELCKEKMLDVMEIPEDRPSSQRSSLETKEKTEKRDREREEKRQRIKKEKIAFREARKRANGHYKNLELTAVLDPSFASHAHGWQTMRYMQENKLLYRIEKVEGMSPYRCILWKRHPPRNFEEQGVQGREGEEEAIRYMLVAMTAQEYVEQVDNGADLSTFVETCCNSCPGASVLLVVEGLDTLLRRREREGYKRITHGLHTGNLFNRDRYEDALVDLTIHAQGVTYRCAKDSCEVSECVVQTHLSLAKQPYWKKKDLLDVMGTSGLLSKEDEGMQQGTRLQNDPSSILASHEDAQNPSARPSMRVPASQVGVRSLFCRALHQIPNIGPKDAHAIAMRFEDLGDLFHWWWNEGDLQETHETFRHQRRTEDIANLRHVDGGNARRVGRSNAERLRKWITGEDPDEMLR